MANSNIYALEFKIKNLENNKTIPTIVHKISSYDKSEPIGDISKGLKSFSGTFTIEMDGQILRKTIVKNGVIIKVQINKYKATEGEKNILQSIANRSIFSCMNDKVENMNWIDALACGLTAPTCFGVMYASCAWDVWAQQIKKVNH